jgi:hypothetical protein
MSFIEQVATLNECGTIVNGVTGCTYDTFMTEMLNIEKSINEAVNTFNRLVNTDAISTLLEGGETSSQLHKDTLLTKLKNAWNKIVELFFQMLDNICNWIYEQVVLQTKYIDKHKDEIMKKNLVYGKENDESYNKDEVIMVSNPSINSYSKITKPNFIEPLMTKSELDKYMNDSGKIDRVKLYDYYKDIILGEVTDFGIELVNQHKSDLISGVKDRYNDVKTRKAKIISIRKKYQSPSKDLTPEDVKEFQNISMAQIESLKAYNKVTLDYCKGATSILKKYIKSEKGEK